LGIVVLAISTRSAIEGGLHPEKAFLLSDSYILSIDEATTENEIYSTVRNAEIHFTELVAENKQNKSENPLVLRAKNSIFKRMHEKVTLGSIARELNTTASYLSTVFKKETGITVHQFIVKEKLLVAANLLCYSQYEIHEIANYLSFSSQSHFGHLFKLHFQMTPNQYRLKYGAQEG
jgi:AraC-like DNA-binding protein